MISVIIPLAPQEDKWKELVLQLGKLPEGSEIILVTGIGDKFDVSEFDTVRCVEGRSGRAGRMNCGADLARNQCLWFLHADSRLANNTIQKLTEIYNKEPNGLYYSDLKFMDDGPKLIKLNEVMVRWRSDYLKMPFGDQGFAIARSLFFKLGGYREDLPYGEDAMFTWRVRQEGYRIIKTTGDIYTSARKYKKEGWGKVTLIHVVLTIKQGLPEQLKLLGKKFL